MSVNYGNDVLWDGDLQPGYEATGVALVIQHAFIRLTTPRGSCPDAPDDGFDVRLLMHDAHTRTGLASIPSRVRAELLKDDRIDSITVRASFLEGELTLAIHGVTSNADTFDLIVGTDGTNVKLLRGDQ